MRSIVVFLIVIGLAAACGGKSDSTTPTARSSPTQGAPSSSAASPSAQAIGTRILPTPIVEVLTPPPDIDTSRWLVYRDEAHGFELKYPPEGKLRNNVYPDGGDSGPDRPGSRIELTIAAGTNLEDKHVFIQATAGTPGTCKPDVPVSLDRVRASGVDFWMERIIGGGLSHGYEGESYWTSDSVSCVTLDMVLTSVDQGVMSPTPPAFDQKAESAVFPAILATFRWRNQ